MIGALNNNWEIVYKDDVESLSKTFEFAHFNNSIAFVNRVAEIAESQNHHPAISINYNIVTISITTHSEGNRVTDKDEKLALSIDEVK
jgi:4a-hydroxytetrahydrobiopterin dehydratase